MKQSQALTQAVAILKQRGWRQSSGIKGDDPWGGGAAGVGPVCMEGAVMAALGIELPKAGSNERDVILGQFMKCDLYAAVKDYLHGQTPYLFNDAPGRTLDEVVDVLEGAALAAAEREVQEEAAAIIAGAESQPVVEFIR